MRAALLCVLMTALSAHASVYYVTVAGLGGEPDYEQRFTANAKDLDKLFKDSGNSAHVYTLTGTQATRAQLTETLASIAHEAKPEDDFRAYADRARLVRWDGLQVQPGRP